MTETPADIIRAGVRCLAGNCLPKVEDHRSREEIIDSIEEKIQAVLKQERPKREQEVRAFGAKHGLDNPTVAALIRFHLDHER